MSNAPSFPYSNTRNWFIINAAESEEFRFYRGIHEDLWEQLLDVAKPCVDAKLVASGRRAPQNRNSPRIARAAAQSYYVSRYQGSDKHEAFLQLKEEFRAAKAKFERPREVGRLTKPARSAARAAAARADA